MANDGRDEGAEVLAEGDMKRRRQMSSLLKAGWRDLYGARRSDLTPTAGFTECWRRTDANRMMTASSAKESSNWSSTRRGRSGKESNHHEILRSFSLLCAPRALEVSGCG